MTDPDDRFDDDNPYVTRRELDDVLQALRALTVSIKTAGDLEREKQKTATRIETAVDQIAANTAGIPLLVELLVARTKTNGTAHHSTEGSNDVDNG